MSPLYNCKHDKHCNISKGGWDHFYKTLRIVDGAISGSSIFYKKSEINIDMFDIMDG